MPKENQLFFWDKFVSGVEIIMNERREISGSIYEGEDLLEDQHLRTILVDKWRILCFKLLPPREKV